MALTLTVQLLTGERHPVAASLGQTVWEFKAQVGRQTGVSPYRQKLASPDGAHLDLRNDAPLASYGLRAGATLLLLERPEEPIPLLLRKANQTSSAYEVLPSETVAQLRARIRAREAVPDDQFWLGYGHETLEAGRRLCDYNIQPGGTVTLNLRLRGGAPL